MSHLGTSPSDRQGRWLRPREAEAIFGYSEKHLRRLAQRREIVARQSSTREVLLLEPSLRQYKAKMERAGTAKYAPHRNVDDSLPNKCQDDDSCLDTDVQLNADDAIYENVSANSAYELVRSQYFLTDCPDVLLNAPQTPYVSVTSDIPLAEVEKLCQSQRIQCYFSDMPAAEFITQRLGIKRVDSARQPALSHGDNVIVAQVSRTSAHATHVLRFTRVQIAL
jgi:hypothetical protein